MSSLSVVIPHYDDLLNLNELLRSLLLEASDQPIRLEVIVVDDCTPGASLALSRLETSIPSLRVIRSPENRGPATARNLGAKAASHDWIWFLDSDVQLAEGSLAGMARVVRLRPDYEAFVCGVGEEPVNRRSFERYKNYLEFSWKPPEGRTNSLDSKSFVISRACFTRTGGFGTSYVSASVEDYEFCYRLLQQGTRIFFTHEVTIFHHHPSFSRQFQLYFDRSRQWMHLKRCFGLKADDFGSTRREALNQLNCFALLLCSLLLVAGGLPFHFGYAALPLAALWLLLNQRLLKVAWRRGESPAFFAAAFVFSCLLSLPVCAGSSLGLLENLRSEP